MPSEIDEAVTLVPGWSAATITVEPLPGGRTNRNFLVRVDGSPFVLRIAAPHAEQLGIHRSDEYAVLRAAADAGIAPRVIWVDEQRGLLVSEFVIGRHWSPHDIYRDGNMARLTAALRTAHALPVHPSAFDPIALGLQFQARCDDTLAPPCLGAIAIDHVRAVASAADETDARCLCHNDIGRGNFIDDGTRLWLLDWECAGIGDAFYDLAIVSHNHRLTTAQELDLLRCYHGRASPADVLRLARAKLAHDFYHVFWYAAHLCTAADPEDLRRCCAFHAARLAFELQAFTPDGSPRHG
jgi:thiamine kinase-like enzyme